MRKNLFLLLPMLMVLLFVQCKEDAIGPEAFLIAEIENAQDKVNIDPSLLPQIAQETIEMDYFDTYIETAAHVSGKGYEVVMASEEYLYFRENGRQILGHRNPDRPGPCGRGVPVNIEELSTVITLYVSNNYPDAEILRAKVYPRGYVVLISGNRLLVFNQYLDFVRETRLFYFCDQIGHPILPSNLPDGVHMYIDDNYPGAELVKAFFVRDRIVVGLLTPDGRVILVFDQNGEFLFLRG